MRHSNAMRLHRVSLAIIIVSHVPCEEIVATFRRDVAREAPKGAPLEDFYRRACRTVKIVADAFFRRRAHDRRRNKSQKK